MECACENLGSMLVYLVSYLPYLTNSGDFYDVTCVQTHMTYVLEAV